MMLAQTPKPPYYAVIFTSLRTDVDENYGQVADQMIEIAKASEGFLGVDSARNVVGITVSYWESEEAIKKFKENLAHQDAQQKGYQKWYSAFEMRIAKVERAYSF